MNRASSSKRQRASFATLAVLGLGASLALQTVHAAPSDDWKVARDNVSQDFPTVGPIPTSAASAQQIHAVQSANSYIGSIKPNQLSSAVADAGTAYPSVSSSASAKSSSSQNYDSKQRTAAASASQSSSSAQADTTVWKWDSGAFGCLSGTPSGTADYCRETGVPVKRAVVPMDTPLAERMVASDDSDSPFEDMWKRQDNDDDNNNNDTNDRSGNGGPPSDINNVDSPDLGWLDLVVGGVPYKNGDLAPSIVWILAVLLLLPLFLIRLIRRSSLIAHVLFTVFVFGCVMIVAFGMRAWLSNNVPTTTLMIVQNVLLQIMPPLLLEPLLNLLAMYSTQGGFPTGVPRVALFLRFINVVALVIFSVAAAYTGVFLNDWDKALKDPGSFTDQDDFPSDQPNNFVKVGPIIGSFMMLVSILGGLLLYVHNPSIFLVLLIQLFFSAFPLPGVSQDPCDQAVSLASCCSCWLSRSFIVFSKPYMLKRNSMKNLEAITILLLPCTRATIWLTPQSMRS